jgi:hypothetical protein
MARYQTATRYNWITLGKFTEADGLRRFGGSTRIHLPIMKERVHEDTFFCKPGARPPNFRTLKKRRASAAKPVEAERPVDLRDLS